MSRTQSHSPFSTQSVYPCPACRLGQIQALPLMEAMACDTCRHIFTTNVERQRLLLADRTPALAWHWNGKNWTGAHVEGRRLSWLYWLSAAAFLLLPPMLIGVSAYMVSAEGELPRFSLVWAGLALLLHGALIGRSLLGFYRLPLGIFLRAIRRKWSRSTSKSQASP
ncbi:MAG: hypothetical protein IGS50_06325 [Synechococcales cyanobacterium C42_A2020_086]|nr:hypothetical protein [Synechococcales cyanobacterium M58_A2018_015]MBF2073364.1 hypothetical protein [Synechococcales cyanobacterium C42_A2020_086]